MRNILLIKTRINFLNLIEYSYKRYSMNNSFNIEIIENDDKKTLVEVLDKFDDNSIFIIVGNNYFPVNKDFKFLESNKDFWLFENRNGIIQDFIVIKKTDFSINLIKEFDFNSIEELISGLKHLSTKDKFFGDKIKTCLDAIMDFKIINKNADFISFENIDNKKIEFCIKSLISRFYSDKDSFTAVHGGDMGDIIYSIPAFKALKIKRVILNPYGFYNTKMNKKCCEILKPLLEKSGFEVEIKEKIYIDDADYFFDIFREGVLDMEKNHLFLTNSEKFFIEPDIKTKFIDINENYIADVVINRSLRYRNPDFDWVYLLEDLDKDIKISFIGTKEEYDVFCKITGLRNKVFYYPTKDLSDAASVIKASKMFIGNQSSCYAIAEGLKTNRIQETCHYTPNCKGTTDNSIDVLTKNDLYSAKKFLNSVLNLDSTNIKKLDTKTILVTLCDIKNLKDAERLVKWINYYLFIKKEIGVDNILVLDNSSNLDFINAIKLNYDMHVGFLNEDNIIVSDIIKQREISILSFTKKMDDVDFLTPSYWRGFSFSGVLADSLNYDRLVFIENSCYIYSDRMKNWVKNKTKNLNSIFSMPDKKRTTSISIISKESFYKLSKFFSDEKGLKYDLWYGIGLTKYNYLPNDLINFDNIPDELCDFKITDCYSSKINFINENLDCVFNLYKDDLRSDKFDYDNTNILKKLIDKTIML